MKSAISTHGLCTKKSIQQKINKSAKKSFYRAVNTEIVVLSSTKPKAWRQVRNAMIVAALNRPRRLKAELI